MIWRIGSYWLSGVALVIIALLNFSVIQSEWPLPGEYELTHLSEQLNRTIELAQVGAQAQNLDEAKIIAQQILNQLEGKNGIHFSGDIESGTDDYGMVTYIIDLMVAIQEPQAIKMLNSYKSRGKGNVDHIDMMWLINSLLIQIGSAQSSAQLILATRSLERAHEQFDQIGTSLRLAAGLYPRNDGVLYLQEVLRDASKTDWHSLLR